MKWEEYYNQPITIPRYIEYVKGFIWPFIQVIERDSGGKRGLEAGCAEGLTSIYLSQKGYAITGLDINAELIEKARGANEYLRGSATFVAGDLFKLENRGKQYDFCFSQGVLEHFDTPQVRELIYQQLSIAPRVIFSVPSKRQKTQDFGDERLLSYDQWVNILSPFRIITSFGFLPNMGLISKIILFPMHFLMPRLREWLIKKYFATQIGFVVTNK